MAGLRAKRMLDGKLKTPYITIVCYNSTIASGELLLKIIKIAFQQERVFDFLTDEGKCTEYIHWSESFVTKHRKSIMHHDKLCYIACADAEPNCALYSKSLNDAIHLMEIKIICMCEA